MVLSECKAKVIYKFRVKLVLHFGRYLKDVRSEGGRRVRDLADFADEQY